MISIWCKVFYAILWQKFLGSAFYGVILGRCHIVADVLAGGYHDGVGLVSMLVPYFVMDVLTSTFR